MEDEKIPTDMVPCAYAADSEEQAVYIFSDNLADSETLKTMLMLSVDEVETFSSPRKLKRALTETPPAVVIIFLSTTESPIVVHKKNKDFKAVFIANDGTIITRANAVKSGADYFFLQPIDETFLCEKILDILANAPKANKKVLLLSQHQHQWTYYEILLFEAECMLATTNDPLQLGNALYQHQPDAIILDEPLTPFGTIEITKIIRQYTTFSALPIICISANHDHHYINEVFAAGADSFFSKPLDVCALNRVLHAQIHRYHETNLLIDIDPLTGLLNHRSTQNRLHNLTGAAKRYAFPLSLIVLKIDHFQSLNQHFGHDLGDKVLKRLSKLLIAKLRSADVIGRYESDKFVIIMPSTQLNDAFMITERLRLQFSKLRYHSKLGATNATFSAGIAQLDHADTTRTLVNRVEEALATAISCGHNRCHIKKPLSNQPQINNQNLRGSVSRKY